MQVKKFEAPTIQEAINVIKREMGPNAIILSKKEHKKGFGLMSKKSIEVTAAVSNEEIEKKNLIERDLPEKDKKEIWSKTVKKQKKVYGNYFENQLSNQDKDSIEISSLAKDKSQEVVTQKRYAYIDGDDIEPISEGEENIDSLLKEVNGLKQVVRDMAADRKKVQYQDSPDLSNMDWSDELIEAYHMLANSGMKKSYVRELIQEVNFDLKDSDYTNKELVQERLATCLMKKVTIADPLKNVGAISGTSDPSIIAIIGPTGVGKTTTIAKIASKATAKNIRVGLVNLDSYKIGAADQLSMYSKLMKLPFRNTRKKEELQQILYDFSSLDLILVDTVGSSQKDQDKLAEIKGLLSSISGIKSLLVLSASTRGSDVSDIVKRYSILQPQGVIFSKLDETSAFGSMFNIHLSSKLPLSYFCVGQKVPDDIEMASSERLADLILDL